MKAYRLFISGTAPYHKELAADVLKKSNIINLVDSVSKADVIYHIFGPDLDKYNLLYWLGSKKHIVHWIGSDTIFYEKEKSFFSFLVNFAKKSILDYCRRRNNLIYIASAPWIGTAVQVMSSFPVDYVLISTLSKARIAKIDISKKFDFITYVPCGRETTYSLVDILRAASENLENSFAIVVPNIDDINDLEWDIDTYENVTVFPKQTHAEMISLICSSKCFLRLKSSGEDAYALTVLEALYCGCNVLWNVPNSGLLGVTFLQSARELPTFLSDGGGELLLSMNDRNEISADVEKRFSEKEWVAGIERTLSKF